MENNRIKIDEWFIKAEHDMDALKDILHGSAHPDVAGVLLQQCVEKYLKGYLTSMGWKLVKTHDLKQLLDEAVKYNPGFNKYYDLLDIITAYYFEEKYPFGKIEVTIDEVKESLKEAKKLINFIKRNFRDKHVRKSKTF